MKKRTLAIIMMVCCFIVLSCNNNTETNTSIVDNNVDNPFESGTEEEKAKCHATPAIGNIYLGTTVEEFEKQKNIFLKNTQSLAGLKIDFIIPNKIIDGCVEEIMIYSQEYEYRRNHSTPWQNFYKQKYKFEDDRFVHDGKRYIIEDNLTSQMIYIFDEKMKEKIHPREGFARSRIHISNLTLDAESMKKLTEDLTRRQQKELTTI